MIYFRRSEYMVFLLPAVAVGLDVDGRPFFEAAWFNWAVGIGDRP